MLTARCWLGTTDPFTENEAALGAGIGGASDGR